MNKDDMLDMLGDCSTVIKAYSSLIIEISHLVDAAARDDLSSVDSVILVDVLQRHTKNLLLLKTAKK